MLARFEGEENSVTLTLREPEGMARGGSAPEFPASFWVETSMLRGEIPTLVAFEDVEEWGDVLGALSAGHDVTWREFERVMEVAFRADEEERWWLIMKDVSYRVTLSVLVSLNEDWFEESYSRLERIKEFIREAGEGQEYPFS